MKVTKPFDGPRSDHLRLSLGSLDPEVARALAWAFDGVRDVEVIEGDLLDVSCEAIVSPGNSFGDMGGGIDKCIDDLHKGEAQRRVRAAIAEHYKGELPVGAALIVEVPGPRFPLLVVAPTMRVPGNVAGTINAYLAMRAALVAVVGSAETGARAIRHLAVPGLATGVGGMPYAEAAQQMRAAYDNVIGDGWRSVVHAALAPYAMHGARPRRSSS